MTDAVRPAPRDDPAEELFPNSELYDVATPRGPVRARSMGAGPPVLLLHGYPQTHAMWHHVVARLRNRFTLVCADLPGYGASFLPPVAPDHVGHSKRAMAADLVAAMRALGHEDWMVGAHDRGARVAHRMALDHPSQVSRLVLLDIAPTREMYRDTSDAFARVYWHWFFLIQSAPLPERMIGLDPDAYFRAKCSDGLAHFDPRALSSYLGAFRRPLAIESSCEDYRAAASIDIAHDDEDGDRRLHQPLLVLWGVNGVVGTCFDPLVLWRERAVAVDGRALPGGHYLAEERPDDVAAAMSRFFG